MMHKESEMGLHEDLIIYPTTLHEPPYKYNKPDIGKLAF
jgi:hypothetical protein